MQSDRRINFFEGDLKMNLIVVLERFMFVNDSFVHERHRRETFDWDYSSWMTIPNDFQGSVIQWLVNDWIVYRNESFTMMYLISETIVLSYGIMNLFANLVIVVRERLNREYKSFQYWRLIVHEWFILDEFSLVHEQRFFKTIYHVIFERITWRMN